MARAPRTSAETEVEAVIVAASAIDTGADVVIATDTSGTILYWNALAERLFGWPVADVLSRNIVDVVVSQQTAEQSADIMRAVLAGKTWTGSFLVRTRDGSPKILKVTDTPVFVDGRVAGIVGVSQPV